MKMKKLIIFLTLFISTLGYSQNVTVDKLTIKTIKANPNATQVLVRNSSTGVMEYIPKDSISGNTPTPTLQQVIESGSDVSTTKDISIWSTGSGGYSNYLSITPNELNMRGYNSSINNSGSVSVTWGIPRIEFNNGLGATHVGFANPLFSTTNLLFPSIGNGTYTLLSSGNTKTINGNSIVGSGDISISGGAAQVNSDWNSVSGVSQILNKPVILGGTGSANYLPKWTSSTTFTNSNVYDNGTNVQILKDVEITAVANNASGLKFTKLNNSGNITILPNLGNTGSVHSNAIDAAGNVYYLSYSYPQKLYKVTPAGVTTLVTATLGFSASGQTKTMVCDTAGNVFLVNDSANVYKVDSAGTVTILTSAITRCSKVFIDSSNNLYVTNTNTNYFYKVTPAAVVTQVNNTAISGLWMVSMDPNGDFYAQSSSGNIYRVLSSTGVTSLVVAVPENVLSVTADKEFNFYAYAWTSEKLYKYDYTGKLIYIKSLPDELDEIAIDKNNNPVMVIDVNGWGRIYKLTYAGDLIPLTESSEMPSAAGLLMNSAGDIYTGYQSNFVKIQFKKDSNTLILNSVGIVGKTTDNLSYDQVMEEVNRFRQLFVKVSPTTTALTSANLNTNFPGSLTGTRVHCPFITGGGIIYEKTITGWISYTTTVVN